MSISEFIRMPIGHLDRYVKMVTTYLEENQSNNWNTDTFRTASLLMVTMSKINKIVQENIKLYSLKQGKIALKAFKSVRYSDKVSLDKTEVYNHRIFVMESGVILVRIKDEQV